MQRTLCTLIWIHTRSERLLSERCPSTCTCFEWRTMWQLCRFPQHYLRVLLPSSAGRRLRWFDQRTLILQHRMFGNILTTLIMNCSNSKKKKSMVEVPSQRLYVVPDTRLPHTHATELAVTKANALLSNGSPFGPMVFAKSAPSPWQNCCETR